MPNVTVRTYLIEDAPQLLELMKDLARFENLIDIFAVTEADLVANRKSDAPEFEAFVADGESGLSGMAIVYKTNWHNDRKPRLVLKGLYINELARGQGAGTALLKAVANYGRSLGVSKIDWVVLKSNKAAEKFYTDHGAIKDSDWDSWLLNQVAISKLAD